MRSATPDRTLAGMLKHLSFSNIVACLALFLSLAGGAYALDLARNSVGASELRANSVRASELARNAVRAPELRADSVGASELREGSVGASEIAAGAVAREDLGFPLGEAAGDAATLTDPVTLAGASGGAGAGYINLASTRLVIGKPGQMAAVHAALTVENPADNGKPATLTVRVLAHGQHEHGEISQTVPDGFSDTVPVAIRCNGLEQGENSFALQASAGAGETLTVRTRTLDVIAFGPIFSPPGRVGFGAASLR